MSSTPRYVPITRMEHQTLSELIRDNHRIDDRSLTEYRELEIKCGVIAKANGSAEVKLGKTRVLVGIKVGIGEPFPDTPDKGVLTVNTELVPIASPTFETGPPNENAIELARVVDRGIRESQAIDTESLCIIPGKKVFIIFADIYVLDHDGNLIDAAAIATTSALMSSKINEYEIKGEDITFKENLIPLPLKEYPVTITVSKVNDNLIIDPCLKEEYVVEAKFSVAVKKDGTICAIQKAGLGTFTQENISHILDLALEKTEKIRKMILEAVKNSETN